LRRIFIYFHLMEESFTMPTAVTYTASVNQSHSLALVLGGVPTGEQGRTRCSLRSSTASIFEVCHRDTCRRFQGPGGVRVRRRVEKERQGPAMQFWGLSKSCLG